MLCIISVRKGSSLKDKNIRPYKGKPLLVNCVEKCLKVFPKVLLLSDSEDYAKYVENLCEVMIDEAVGDRDDVTIRLRKCVERLDFKGRVILCQCTSPNIKIESYEGVRDKSLELKDDEVLISCVEVTQKPSAFFLMDGEGNLQTAIKGMPIVSKPRQLLEKVYYYNGGVTSFHSQQLFQDSLFENSKMKPFMISEEEILDIDREDDYRK